MKFYLIFLFLVFIGCSEQAPTGKSRAYISLSGLTAGGVSYDGGAVLKLVGSTTHEYVLTDSNVIELPRGTWTMYLVGFQGPDQFGGQPDCRKLENVVLSENEQTVTFSGTSNCFESVSLDMINKRNPAALQGSWDNSKWDKTLWAP